MLIFGGTFLYLARKGTPTVRRADASARVAPSKTASGAQVSKGTERACGADSQ